MLKHLTPVILISIVTACSSSLERRHINGSDEYTKVNESPELAIPHELKVPRFSHEYDIPSLGRDAGHDKMGKALDIRPPLQILPLAEGTRVEEGSDHVKIVIDSIDNELDLKKEVFSALENFLKRKDIGINLTDFTAGIIQTDWIENQEVIDSSLWGKDKIYTLKQRYEFDIKVSPYGKTGSLVIKLIDHQESYDGDKKDIELTAGDKQRYTIDMLNNAVAYISKERKLAIKAKQIKQSLGINIELVQSPEVYWVAKADFANTWDRLRIVLPELGFEITDMNRDKKLFYLNYDAETGFWASLWGDAKLPLEKGAYRLELSALADKNQTRLSLKDLSGKSLSDEIMINLYQSLSKLMSEERALN